MTELIELEEIVLHAVIFKMRGDDVAVGIVRRMLYRAEIRHVLVLRDDDQTAGMLSGGPFYAHEALCEPVLLRLARLEPALFEILHHIAVGRLFGERADRAGAEDMVGAEQCLRVFMCPGLILA